MSARRAIKIDSTTDEVKKGEHIHIYDAWCKACGICVAICPRQVLAINEMGYPYVANEANCTRCGICELHCPDFAIDVQKVGEIPFEAAHLTRLQCSLPPDEALPEDEAPPLGGEKAEEKKLEKKVVDKSVTDKKGKSREKTTHKKHKKPEKSA